MYVAMDKGPINKHHVLLLPIEHRANSLALSSAAYLELERYLSALRTCFASQASKSQASLQTDQACCLVTIAILKRVPV